MKPYAVIITPDYNSDQTPDSVKIMKPTLYKEGNGYCCFLGEDPQIGIFGCGKTMQEAMEDWDRAYHYLLNKDPHLLSIYSSTKKIHDQWVGWRDQDNKKSS